MPKFDAFYAGTDEATQHLFRFFTFGFNRSVGVRGPQKLALQWLKCFMTTKGSDPTNLEYGTEFSNLIGSNVRAMQDVQDVVALCIQDCNEQILQIQQKTQPDLDELLLTATLVKFNLTGADGFDAYVTISNAKSQEVTVNLPSLATRT
jgi:hypothetical protein